MMSCDRYLALEQGTAALTPEEIADGWHFCLDWDCMLIHPSHPEFEACACAGGDAYRAKTKI